jgi:hypothetical protein
MPMSIDALLILVKESNIETVAKNELLKLLNFDKKMIECIYAYLYKHGED